MPNKIPRSVWLTGLLVALPFVFAFNRYYAFIVGITLINVLWATGMNLLYGYTGLMPLMFAGIAGISAYTMLDLTMQHGWSFWAASPVAVLAAALVGTVLGLPALRLRGFYFTLCSLVIQAVLTLAFIYFSGLTNGDTGISRIPAPDLGPFAGSLSGTGYDAVLAVVAAGGIIIVNAIMHSQFGRKLIAVREDDILADTLGINVVRCKLLVFFIGSIFAGVGGVLYAPYVGFVSPRSFDLLVSLNIWLMVAFGGRGTMIGPVIGAVILAPIPFLLQELYMLKDILYGILIIAVIVLMPRGIAGYSGKGKTPVSAAAGPRIKAGQKP
jgi:branched-chain amino acid transport system permease protein